MRLKDVTAMGDRLIEFLTIDELVDGFHIIAQSDFGHTLTLTISMP